MDCAPTGYERDQQVRGVFGRFRRVGAPRVDEDLHDQLADDERRLREGLIDAADSTPEVVEIMREKSIVTVVPADQHLRTDVDSAVTQLRVRRP